MAIHDSIILSYNVDFKKKSLALILLDDMDNCFEINFFEVLTHSFENILYSNTILSIEVDTIENFLKENKQALSDGQKYYWPIMFENNNELSNILSEKKLKYYKIYSSFGLDGWILCKGYSKVYKGKIIENDQL